MRADAALSKNSIEGFGKGRAGWTASHVSDNCVSMSDMGSERITIRIPGDLGGRLRHRSRIKGQTESDLVREALETYLGRSGSERSAFELAEEAGMIGCVPRGRGSRWRPEHECPLL